MPARSNEFQRIICAIQSHVSKRGTVTESKFLLDRDTQSPVEVDIVVEDFIGGHPIVIGIECTARGRPATIEWYRAMVEKHAALPISQTILVSKSGFTPEVVAKAKKNNIQLLTPAQANTFRWKALFKKIKNATLVDVSFSLAKCSMILNGQSRPEDLADLSANTLIRGIDNDIPLGNLIMHAARSSGLTKMILGDIHRITKQTDHFEFSFSLPPDAHILNAAGERLSIGQVSATLVFRKTDQALSFSAHEFNNKVLATAPFPDRMFGKDQKKEAVATISTRDDGAMKMTILSSDNQEIDMEIQPQFLTSK